MTAKEVINLCGGNTAVAKRLRVPMRTVIGWGVRGTIPQKHLVAIHKAYPTLIGSDIVKQGVKRDT